MKSKRLIIILSVLIFLTVLIVINSTLFTLQSVSVNWLTTTYNLKGVKDYDIVDKVKMGQNIFLVKKDEIISKLEKDYPYIRIVSIETKFPNKLVIHSAERESLFAIKISDNEYAIIDEMGKVLSIKNGSIFEGAEANLGTRPINVNFQSLSIKVDDFEVGKSIKSDYIEYVLSSLSYSLRESSYTPTTSKGVIKSIDIISKGESSQVCINTRNGMILDIDAIEEYTTDKLLLAFERYNYLHNEGVVDCTISVWYCEDTKSVVAKFLW